MNMTTGPAKTCTCSPGGAAYGCPVHWPAARTMPPYVDVPWNEILSGIAQGAINITEGHTTIEAGSQVHRAMLALCEKWTAMERGAERLPKSWQAAAAHLAGYER